MSRPRNILIVGSIGLVLLVLLAWFFVFSPRQSTVSQAQAQTTAAEQQTAELNRQIAQLEKLKAALPQNLAQLAALKAGFPSTAQIPEVIAELRDTAAAAGCTVVSLSAAAPAIASAPPPSVAPSGSASASPTTGASQAPAESFSDVATMPIKMSVTGTYPQLVAFLKNLETAPRAYLMTSATVGGGPAAGKGGPDTLTVSGTMFVLSGAHVTVPSQSVSPAPTPSA